jgi:hypothetical protein
MRAFALAVAIASMVVGAAAIASADGLHVEETAIRFAAGGSRRVQYYGLHGDFGFSLWSSADRWLTSHDITGRWIVEPWVSFVNDEHNPHPNNGLEFGVSPLFGKLTFGSGRLRPFLEGGEGILYTTRRKSTLGSGGFFFSSQFGVGLEYEIRDGLAFTFAARYRHISTAGITNNNAGLNSALALIGLTFR